MERTGGAADDAPSAISPEVALIADAHEGFRTDVGVAYRTVDQYELRRQSINYDIRTTFHHTSRINDRWLNGWMSKREPRRVAQALTNTRLSPTHDQI